MKTKQERIKECIDLLESVTGKKIVLEGNKIDYDENEQYVTHSNPKNINIDNLKKIQNIIENAPNNYTIEIKCGKIKAYFDLTPENYDEFDLKTIIKNQINFNNEHSNNINKNEDVIEETEQPSEGLTKKQKSNTVKKAEKGENVGKGNFNKVEKKAEKEYGSKETGEKVAAAAMWKNRQR